MGVDSGGMGGMGGEGVAVVGSGREPGSEVGAITTRMEVTICGRRVTASRWGSEPGVSASKARGSARTAVTPTCAWAGALPVGLQPAIGRLANKDSAATQLLPRMCDRAILAYSTSEPCI